MKKVLSFLLIVFSLVSCQLWDSDDNKTESPAPAPVTRATVGFNFTMSAFQQLQLSGNESKTVQRSAQAFTTDQVLTGELVATNKTTPGTENYSWSIYLNQSDLSVQSNKTIVLDVAEYDFQLTLTKGNQQYIGAVSGYNIVDGTNDVPMVIKPVIGDTITDVTLLENVGTIQFQYSKTELAKFTAPKLGIAIDGGAESIYAIDPATGLVGNYFNLAEGQHSVVVKFYDGDTQLAKSNPAQETFNVTLGNNITIDLIPLEGETSFTLTENGSNAKFKLNLPTALVTEVGGKENLEAKMSIVGPKNPIREIDLTVNSTVDGSGDTIWFAETTLDSYHYDTVSYTVTFSDTSKSPKEQLAQCVKENVTLSKDGSNEACSMTMKRAGIATGNLYGTLAINVFNTGNEPLPGVKIKANDQLIGITGAGTFGAPGYLKHRLIKGNYKIKAEDIGTVEQDVTVDALETQNIDLILNQNLTWKFVDGGGENGINRDPAQGAAVPQLTVFNNKLYAIWGESDGANNQIRTAVYNGNDSSPSWGSIDGNRGSGLNKNPERGAGYAQLTVFNNKLYAAWHEFTGSVFQVQVAVYNGDDSSPSWSFVDGIGINKNQEQDSQLIQLTVFKEKLYATWYESNGSNTQIRIAVYNGNDVSPVWNFVDGNGVNGMNKNVGQNAFSPQLTVFNDKLYVTWGESNGTKGQVRVAVYNDNDASPSWSFVDGNSTNGINKNPEQDAEKPQLTVFNGKLYATWSEFHNSTSRRSQIVVYNGNDTSPEWKFVDTNLNNTVEQHSHHGQLTVFHNRLHFIERTLSQDLKWIRVSVYNGDDLSPYWRTANGIDRSGINQDFSQNAKMPQLTVFKNKLYAAWQEPNGVKNQIRVAVASY